MTTVYKVTNRNMCTYERYKWHLGEERKIVGEESKETPQLCTSTVLHAFSHLLQMLIFRHVGLLDQYNRPRLFMGEGPVVINGSDKIGLRRLKLTKELEWPKPTAEQLLKLVLKVRNIKKGSNRHKVLSTLNSYELMSVLRDIQRSDHHITKKKLQALYRAYDRICGKPKEKVSK